jgi:peptidoglycan/LPS O-acetylase OafA/YrhL
MWSLAVEEQFYLAYPIYLMILPPNTLVRRVAFFALFAFASSAESVGRFWLWK